uniref:Peptidylprolyl isomerase like 6 n=1 Tax=Gadus morhua TaxID=8049 RepID=A0A8C4ZJH0_GADMO
NRPNCRPQILHTHYNVSIFASNLNDKTQICGLVKETSFHIAKGIAEGLKQRFPGTFLDPTIHPFLECEWHEYLCNKKMELGGEMWNFSKNLMCFLNGKLLGDEKDLGTWAETQWNFTFTSPHALVLAIAKDHYWKHLNSAGNQFVFMDIDIRSEGIGRLVFELFSNVCPKTCKNFRALCTGELGLSQGGLMLGYRGSLFHRVVPNGWIQGGDISPAGKGDGGESIYGPYFEDESFAISHNKRGILGMANQGPHSNRSQFYITMQPAPWMDKSYVAFGQLVEGTDFMKKLEEVPTCNERPKQDCRVADCGVLEP